MKKKNIKNRFDLLNALYREISEIKCLIDFFVHEKSHISLFCRTYLFVETV